MKRTTTNWSAFDTRNTRSKNWKSTRTEYTVNASQSAIDDNAAAIARLIEARKKEQANG